LQKSLNDTHFLEQININCNEHLEDSSISVRLLLTIVMLKVKNKRLTIMCSGSPGGWS